VWLFWSKLLSIEKVHMSEPADSGKEAVPKEAFGVAEMKDITAASFGLVIAFLLPGMFGMYGLAYWSPQVAALLEPALATNTTIGPSVILLLVALAVGLILSAARYLLFEKCVCRKAKLDEDLFARLIQAERLATFKDIVDAHYRYHQFYGGCFLAALIIYSGWLNVSYISLSWTWRISSLLVFVLLETLLGSSAAQCFQAYVKRGNMAGKNGSEV
jgi:hypothetical protein